MQKIIWTDKFSVKHSQIDSQHQVIIDLINRLIDQQKDFDRDTVRAIISDLVKYGMDHLVYEENLLKEIQYPELVKHRHEHFLYVQKATRFMKDSDGIDQQKLQQLIDFLHDWWVHHILHEDMKYVDSL